MKQEASITGCIPCFNGERTLRRSIEGLRAQSLPLEELLVVDDGSTDGSRRIAWGSADRIVTLPRNTGRGAARHSGIREAKTEFVLFCDAGMSLEPQFAARALEQFKDENVAAVFGAPTDPEARSLADRWRQRHLFKADLKIGLEHCALLATGGVLMRRATVLAVGNFNARLAQGEDEELGRRLLAAGYDVICDPGLRLKPLEKSGIREVLARYERWNCAPGHVPTLREYRQLLGYSRAMAQEDRSAGDVAAMGLTLLTPHYIFWSRRIRAWKRAFAQNSELQTGHARTA